MAEELDITQPNTQDEPILKVEHLKKYFPIATNLFGKPTRFLRAVDDISFEVQKGKTIGVVGESGCGKTTLGRTVLKLHGSNGGRILFNGTDITDLKKSRMIKYRTDIQLIFQDPYSSLPPRMTVGSIIAEAVRVHKIVPKNEVHDYVLDVMKKCGLKPQHYDRYPHEFSGGQRQRICIARALAVKPKLVICDEPVSALDVSIQAQIINLLKELQKKDDLTYVFISHDLSVVKYITDNILVMYLGNAMELSETEELFENPLHPYTKALFSAVPAPDPKKKMNRIMLEGDIPSPANPPDGCKFHTRCKECMNVCKFRTPEYLEVKPGHFVACHLYNEDIMSNLADYDAQYELYKKQKDEEAHKAAVAALKKRHPFTWKKRLPELEKEEAEEAAAEEQAVQPPVNDEVAAEEPPVQEPAVKEEPPAAEEPPVQDEAPAATDEAPVQDEEPIAEPMAEESKPAEEKKPAAKKTSAARPSGAKTTGSRSKPAAARTTGAKTGAAKPAAKKPGSKGGAKS